MSKWFTVHGLRLFIYSFLFSIFYSLFPSYTLAQVVTIYPGNVPVEVGAQVGDFVVNISGLASPNASVILNSESEFVSSTVADNAGYFSFTNVQVKSGATSFCFNSIDFKRLGESESCLDFEPIVASRNFTDIFLPPTIGLFKRTINAGEEALIYGFSMPGAKVDTKAKSGQNFKTDTDQEGYYEHRFQNVPAGTYLLASDAKLEEKVSLEPKKNAQLEAVSATSQITTKAQDLIEETQSFLTSSIYGFFLVVFILLALILILLLIVRPPWFVAIFDKFKKKMPMHHDWLLDFIREVQVAN